MNNIDFANLDEEDIDDYISHLKGLGTLGNVTINNKLRDLRAFIIYAHGKDCCKLSTIKIPKIQEPLIIPLTDEQLADVYEACLLVKNLDRVRDYTIMRVLEETGMRLTECINLRITDINITRGSISLNKTKNKKTREVYLTPAMKKELNLYLDARKRFLDSHGIAANNNLWIVTKAPRIGKSLVKDTLQERIREYGQLAGIPVRVSPHTFRHTFARNFIINGGDIFTLQQLLGHSTLEMVKKYVYLFSEDRQNNYLSVMKTRQKKKSKAVKSKFY